jgi:hypothetical protein
MVSVHDVLTFMYANKILSTDNPADDGPLLTANIEKTILLLEATLEHLMTETAPSETRNFN